MDGGFENSDELNVLNLFGVLFRVHCLLKRNYWLRLKNGMDLLKPFPS